MTKNYQLLTEAWLPVRFNDGSMRDLGLLEVFERAGEIAALAETAPPSLIAQYRLLLAITHRALTRKYGSWKDKDRALWYRDGLPLDAIREYLECWHERFWLFHSEFPFAQVAALASAEETRDKRKPWTQISLASANGNAPVVFDHSYDPSPVAVTPAEAVRTLLGFLQFTPGGLVKTLRDSDKAGALANTAAVVPIGSTLAQTLCLALHLPPLEGRDDAPAWEKSPATVAELQSEPMLASGPNDRYTRLSRAVLLLREPDERILWLRFAAGLALGDDPNAPDPMASYRAGTNALVRLSFSEGRALWRDLPALVPDATGHAATPASVLEWASTLRSALDSAAVDQHLLVAGLASDQAKLLRWRSEQISLPSRLLSDPNTAGFLRTLVGEAEDFFRDLRGVTSAMLAETLPDSKAKDTYSRARALFDTGPAGALYFATLERELAVVMRLLADSREEAAETHWCRAQTKAAEQAWTAVRRGMGQSPAAMRAEARQWPRFRVLLRKRRPDSESPTAATAEEVES